MNFDWTEVEIYRVLLDRQLSPAAKGGIFFEKGGIFFDEGIIAGVQTLVCESLTTRTEVRTPVAIFIRG
jgi:hypothetical protein